MTKIARLYVFILMALLTASIMLTGCSGDTPENPDAPFIEASPPPISPNLTTAKDRITLNVWLDLDFTKNDTLFDEIADEFEEAYRQTYQREINVNIQSFIGESIPAKVKRAVQNGTPPDVAQGHVYAMAGQGLAEPLNRQWAEWGEDVDEQFLPAAMQEVIWKQTRYGIPLDIYTLVLLYNRDHFDEAGVPYLTSDYTPTTLQNAIITLTNPEQNRYGTGFTADPRYVYTWLAGAGGDVLAGSSEDGYTFTLDARSNIDALRFLTSMAGEGYGPLPTTRPRDYEDTRQLFLDGKVSIIMGGPWDIHLIQSSYPDFPLGVAQLPQTPAADSAASVLGSTGLFIPRGARHQDVAFEFMKWVSSDRYAIPMARRLGRYPAKSWLQTTPYFSENLLLNPFFNQLNSARPYRLDLFPEAQIILSNAIKASFYGKDPAQALIEAQQLATQANTAAN